MTKDKRLDDDLTNEQFKILDDIIKSFTRHDDYKWIKHDDPYVAGAVKMFKTLWPQIEILNNNFVKDTKRIVELSKMLSIKFKVVP